MFTNISIESYDQVSTYLYAVEGSVLFVFNSFAVFRYLRDSNLRVQRDSLLIVGCLIFDTLFGITYMSSGFYRIPFLFKYKGPVHYNGIKMSSSEDSDFPAVTKWQCIGTPALLFIIITPTAGLFALITSLDRFYCVMFPLKYLKRRVPYALTIMFSAYVIALIPVIKSIVDTYPYRELKTEPITCSLSNAITAGNFLMLRIIRVVCTLSCVLIYIPIFVRMYKNIRAHYEMTVQSARNQSKLLRMTFTIALITSNTIILFTIPDIITLFNPNYSSNLFFIMNLNKGVVNIIIFLTTQKGFRRVLLGKSENSDAMLSVKRAKTVTVASHKGDGLH